MEPSKLHILTYVILYPYCFRWWISTYLCKSGSPIDFCSFWFGADYEQSVMQWMNEWTWHCLTAVRLTCSASSITFWDSCRGCEKLETACEKFVANISFAIQRRLELYHQEFLFELSVRNGWLLVGNIWISYSTKDGIVYHPELCKEGLFINYLLETLSPICHLRILWRVKWYHPVFGDHHFFNVLLALEMCRPDLPFLFWFELVRRFLDGIPIACYAVTFYGGA